MSGVERETNVTLEKGEEDEKSAAETRKDVEISSTEHRENPSLENNDSTNVESRESNHGGGSKDAARAVSSLTSTLGATATTTSAKKDNNCDENGHGSDVGDNTTVKDDYEDNLPAMKRLNQLNHVLWTAKERLWKKEMRIRMKDMNNTKAANLVSKRRKNASTEQVRAERERNFLKGAFRLHLRTPLKLKRRRSSSSLAGIERSAKVSKRNLSGAAETTSGGAVNGSLKLTVTMSGVKEKRGIAARNSSNPTESREMKAFRSRMPEDYAKGANGPQYMFEGVQMKPYRSLLTTLILNKLREDPQSVRSLRNAVKKAFKDVVDDKIVHDLVSDIDTWCSVFSAVGLAEKKEPKSLDDGRNGMPPVAFELAQNGNTREIGCYWGAGVEERSVEWIWKSCQEWQLPSEIVQQVEKGDLWTVLRRCGPKLFSKAHKWMWQRNEEWTPRPKMYTLVENAEFDALDKIIEPVIASLRGSNEEALAKSAEDSPFAWLWHRSIEWRGALEATDAFKKIANAEKEASSDPPVRSPRRRFDRKNDGEIFQLNREQDRLLANVDQHVKVIEHLRSAKMRLRAEEEEYVRRICDLLDKKENSFVRSSPIPNLTAAHSSDGGSAETKEGEIGIERARSNNDNDATGRRRAHPLPLATQRNAKRTIEWTRVRPPRPRVDAHSVRERFLSRMQRKERTKPVASTRQPQPRQQQGNHPANRNRLFGVGRRRDAPSLISLPNLSRYSRESTGSELNSVSESVDFEKMLRHFSSVGAKSDKKKSQAAGEKHATTSDVASAVFTPSWRRIEIKGDVEDAALVSDSEDTSDEKYLRLHNAYLLEMAERYRQFRERLKKERAAQRASNSK